MSEQTLLVVVTPNPQDPNWKITSTFSNTEKLTFDLTRNEVVNELRHIEYSSHTIEGDSPVVKVLDVERQSQETGGEVVFKKDGEPIVTEAYAYEI